jgi:hypothetical protein
LADLSTAFLSGWRGADLLVLLGRELFEAGGHQKSIRP